MILLLLALLALPPNGGQQQKPPNEKENASANLALGLEDQEGSAKQANTPSKQSEERPAQPKDKSVWGDIPTWVLVATGAIGAWIALCTLRDIQRQTKNAKTRAEAALRNAQAVIDAERPWIFVHWVPRPAEKVHVLYMENHGRTPAEIVDIAQQDEILPLGRNRKELNDTPQYPEAMLVSPRMLGPGQKYQPAEWATPVKQVTDDFGALVESHERLYFYGRVRYKDVFSQVGSGLHETRCCFFWSPTLDEFIVGGPSSYPARLSFRFSPFPSLVERARSGPQQSSARRCSGAA